MGSDETFDGKVFHGEPEAIYADTWPLGPMDEVERALIRLNDSIRAVHNSAAKTPVRVELQVNEIEGIQSVSCRFVKLPPEADG